MLHTEFQEPEQRDSEEDLFNISLCIFLVQTQDPLSRGSYNPEGHLRLRRSKPAKDKGV